MQSCDPLAWSLPVHRFTQPCINLAAKARQSVIDILCCWHGFTSQPLARIDSARQEEEESLQLFQPVQG